MRKTKNLGLALYDSTDKMVITGAENSLNHNMELLDEAAFSGEASKAFLEKNGFVGDADGVGQQRKINLLSGNYTKEDFALQSIVTSNGTVKQNTSTYIGYLTSPLIPITGGKTYGLLMPYAADQQKAPGALAGVNDGYGLFGSDGTTVVAKQSFMKLENCIVLIQVPAGAAYIRFTIRTSGSVSDINKMGSYYDSAVNTFCKWVLLPDMNENAVPSNFAGSVTGSGTTGTKSGELREILRADGSVLEIRDGLLWKNVNVFGPLYGKTIVNLGDSIFGNLRPPKDLSTLIAKYTGAVVHNGAFGGCRMSAHTGHWDAFSMYRLADSIATRDWSLQEEAIGYSDRTSYAEVPLATLKALDFSKVDVLTIGYGTNDFTANKKLDSEGNATDCATLAGALRYSLDKLLTAYPGLRIVVLGAIFRTNLDSNNSPVADFDTWQNSLGLKLADYNGKLREVCEEFHIAYMENSNIGLNKYSRLIYFPETDGTHPNANGLDVYARHIARNL